MTQRLYRTLEELMKHLFLSLILITNLFSAKMVAVPAQSIVEEGMREKIHLLGEKNSFVYVDLGLTDEQHCLMDQIVCKMDDYYNQIGSLDLLKEELPAFLKKIGNEDEKVISAVTSIIVTTVHNVLKASRRESAWVSVRGFTGMDEGIPRWHTDGCYFGPYPYPGLVFKFTAVLKGSPTLLYPLSASMREAFEVNRANRLFLSELLDINKAESPKKGEGVFFIVGDPNFSAVHSEPIMSENRLFFSILPGDESEIQELYRRWHR